jgi:hypothetical protein
MNGEAPSRGPATARRPRSSGFHRRRATARDTHRRGGASRLGNGGERRDADRFRHAPAGGARRVFLASLFSQVPPALIEASHDFGLGEALVAGPISPTPTCGSIGCRLSLEGGADLPASSARRKHH